VRQLLCIVMRSELAAPTCPPRFCDQGPQHFSCGEHVKCPVLSDLLTVAVIRAPGPEPLGQGRGLPVCFASTEHDLLHVCVYAKERCVRTSLILAIPNVRREGCGVKIVPGCPACAQLRMMTRLYYFKEPFELD
jgi:hypothetical protein